MIKKVGDVQPPYPHKPSQEQTEPLNLQLSAKSHISNKVHKFVGRLIPAFNREVSSRQEKSLTLPPQFKRSQELLNLEKDLDQPRGSYEEIEKRKEEAENRSFAAINALVKKKDGELAKLMSEGVRLSDDVLNWANGHEDKDHETVNALARQLRAKNFDNCIGLLRGGIKVKETPETREGYRYIVQESIQRSDQDLILVLTLLKGNMNPVSYGREITRAMRETRIAIHEKAEELNHSKERGSNATREELVESIHKLSKAFEILQDQMMRIIFHDTI